MHCTHFCNYDNKQILFHLHNAGFFSNCSVKLDGLLHFYKENNVIRTRSY